MIQFRFRAAALLDLRGRQLDAAKADLAHARAVASEAEVETLRACGQCRDAEAAYCIALRASVDADTLERHRNWIAQLQVRAQARQRTWDACRGESDRAADAVHIVHRQVRVLERLRERGWQRHLQAVRRMEMKEMNQFAAQRFMRRELKGDTERGR